MTSAYPSVIAQAPLSYLNNDSTAAPPYACLEMHGDSNVSATGTVSLSARKPSGSGSYYLLDNGKGAAANTAMGTAPPTAAAFGQALSAVDSVQWAYFTGDPSSLTAWVTTLGPITGHWDLSTAGTAMFVYAGVSDSANNRIQVQAISSGSASGGGDTTCGCCDCTNCIKIADSVVGGCPACPNGAAAEYQFNIGSFNAYPPLGGVQTVTYGDPLSPSSSSSGTPCVWYSMEITVDAAAWTPNTEYIIDDYVLNDSGKQYICTGPGTSGPSGGPTGTGTGIVDGDATWDYSP